MNTEQWQKMPQKERAESIVNGVLKIHSRAGIRADSMVGDDNACVTMHQVSAGGVFISEWHEKPEDALVQAAESIKSWREELDK